MLKNFLWFKTGKSGWFIEQMRENAKRRTWLFALLSFVLLLSYPVFTALQLARYGRATAGAVEVGHDILGINNGWTLIFVTIGAVLCAVEGFSWLSSRKKTDMYISQPITAGRRFAFTYMNGILLCFLPYLVSLVLAMFVLAGAGALVPVTFVEVLFTVAVAFVYFLAVYNLALIAVMLSGRKGMTLFFLLTAFLYDIVLRLTLESYCSDYFTTYYQPGDRITLYFSPPMRMFYTLYEADFSWNLDNGMTAAGHLLKNIVLPMLPGLGILLLEAAIFGAAAYYCYKKRPMEAASSPLAFRKTKGPLKALLMVPAGLLGSLCFCNISGNNDNVFVAVSGLLIGVLFAQAVMEIIYEGDLRAFARHKVSFAAGAAVTIFLYLFFVMDLSGYDTWVPDAGQVESAAIGISFSNRYNIMNVDEMGNTTNNDSYVMLQTMKMTDVSSVLSLAQDGMGKNAMKRNQDSKLIQCTVKYHMKNGSVKYRDFFFDYEQEKTVLDILFANREYKEAANQVLSARMDRIFEKGRGYYYNGMDEYSVTHKDATALMRAYQEDVWKMSFSDVKDKAPCGILKLRYKEEEDAPERTLEYPVFPSYKKTIEYLLSKKAELYMAIDPATVGSVQVMVYHDRGDVPAAVTVENGMTTYTYDAQSADYVEKEYTKRSEIEEILKCVYPQELVNFAYTDQGFDMSISIGMKSVDAEGKESGDWEYFLAKKELLPDFVKKDIGRE